MHPNHTVFSGGFRDLAPVETDSTPPISRVRLPARLVSILYISELFLLECSFYYCLEENNLVADNQEIEPPETSVFRDSFSKSSSTLRHVAEFNIPTAQ